MEISRKEAIKKWGEIIGEMETKKSELDSLLGAARQSNEQTTNALNDAKNKLNEILSIESQINQKLQTIEQSRSNAGQKEEEVKNKFEAISKIHSEAENKKIEIEQLESETEALLEKNNEQSEKVSDLLQKAAAGTLFKSFNIRKREHERGALLWTIMVGISVFVLVGIAYWITWLSHNKGFLSYEFLLKLSISFPIIYWLIFATRQYSKSRALEEEYAFKSAISLSLEAYRDLVKKEAGESTKTDVIPLISDAVGKIFSSPTTSIIKDLDKEETVEIGLFEKLADILKKFIK